MLCKFIFFLQKNNIYCYIFKNNKILLASKMTNKKNMQNQFSRMKALMNYGLNESKKQPYSGIEYTREGADGKLYGIVREGTKFYIKVSSKKENPLVENFDYIGGFRNRKSHEYNSFANAQKNFDFKLRSVAEAYGRDKGLVIESWNPDKGVENSVKATETMKKEIARERQIMENAEKIANSKPQTVKPIKGCEGGDPFCQKADKEYTSNAKDNIKAKVEKGGDAKKANKYKNATVKGTDIKEGTACPVCGETNCVCDKGNKSETLGWNDDEEYMDKSNGTEIGDSMPFDGEMGKQIDEAIDDIDGDADFTDDVEGDDELDVDTDADSLDGDDELDVDTDVDSLDGDDEMEFDVSMDDEDEDDIEDRLSDLEDLVNKIADKLGVGTYSDDDLYDDSDDEGYNDSDEMDYDNDSDDDEEPIEDEDDVYESKSYRAMKLREAKARRINEDGMSQFTDNGRVPRANMNKLNDFGKHPAYRKKVMSLPPKDMQEFPGYYDMNDESVYNENPYGEKIGNGTPFNIKSKDINNAISESIYKILKKK